MEIVLLAILVMLGVVIISHPLLNPIATMYGLNFLLFYGFIISLTLIICRLALDEDETSQQPVPFIPENLDPYEIAYLRAGEVEMIKVGITNLIQKDFFKLNDETIELTLKSTLDLETINLELTKIEIYILENFKYPRRIKDIFQLSRLLTFRKYYEIYQQKLLRENLLYSNEIKYKISFFKGLGTLIILGLGGYKLIVAFSQGNTNVLFLIIMGIIGTIILRSWCKVPRMSNLGKKYLNRLQKTFEKFQDKAFLSSETSENFYSLAVAIFGVSILSGTPYADFNQICNNQIILYRKDVSTSTNHYDGDFGGFGGCG
jgi:uncharacterized protein (TIGR04222 family)